MYKVSFYFLLNFVWSEDCLSCFYQLVIQRIENKMLNTDMLNEVMKSRLDKKKIKATVAMIYIYDENM